MNAKIIDEGTAVAALKQAHDKLHKAAERADRAVERLNDSIVRIRPAGLLTVDEMGKAIGSDRNYIDRTWSSHGTTTKGRQTRVRVVAESATAALDARKAYDELAKLAKARKVAEDALDDARAERNRTVTMVYQSKILGPSAIATHVGIDRNHVGRIARRAGIPPVHRRGSKNQYTTTG